MSRRRDLGFLIAGVALVAAACTGSSNPPGSMFHPAGGTLRVGLVLNGQTDGCGLILCGPETDDPQIEFIPDRYELERCCLLRTLLSFSGQDTSHGGTVLRPDLASALPAVSSDGLTWTFSLKRGLHYAPPLQRIEITSADFVRSFERMLSKPPASLPSAYGDELDYYLGRYLDLTGAVSGASDYAAGKTEHISGIEAPNRFTLVFHLTHPDGGFGYLLSLPSTAPIPPDPFDPSARFGVATDHARFYSGYLVSSGPYMLEGAGAIDFSKPTDQQLPAPGDGPGAMVLVRNPSWQPSTDPLRSAQPDRIVITAVDSAAGAQRLIQADAIDVVLNADSAGPAQTSGSGGATTASIATPKDWINYLEFNLAMPPLDDIHVRRAVNYAIDRTPLADAYDRAGLNTTPDAHIGLDSEEDNLLLSFDPYKATTGDLAGARSEMARSPYDHNHDGRCDDPVCNGVVLYVEPEHAGDVAVATLLARDLRAVGIRLRVTKVSSERMGATYSDPSLHVAMRLVDWLKDITSGATYFTPLFGSPHSGLVQGWFALDKLGATSRELRRWGYRVRSVPDVDNRIESCLRLTFGAQVRCWADLDQYLMTEVVPWAPLVSLTSTRRLSARVRSATFDQSDSLPLPSLDGIVLRSGPAPAPSPTIPGPVPSIPDGTYRTTVTKADLYRFDPKTHPSDIDENTGTETISIRDGWWEIRQSADHTVYKAINVGTYRGAGDRVTFTTTAPPDNVIEGPHLRWSFDGTALRFRLVGCGKVNAVAHNPRACQDLSTPFLAHPWVKVG